MENTNAVVPSKIGCIMPIIMFLNENFDFEDSLPIDMPVCNAAKTRSFSFAGFLGYAKALQARDEPKCKV